MSGAALFVSACYVRPGVENPYINNQNLFIIIFFVVLLTVFLSSRLSDFLTCTKYLSAACRFFHLWL